MRGERGPNLKCGVFVFGFFASLHIFLDTCPSKITAFSEGKLSHNHSIPERKWLIRVWRRMWGKCQREAGVRSGSPERKWFWEQKWHVFQREQGRCAGGGVEAGRGLPLWGCSGGEGWASLQPAVFLCLSEPRCLLVSPPLKKMGRWETYRKMTGDRDTSTFWMDLKRRLLKVALLFSAEAILVS